MLFQKEMALMTLTYCFEKASLFSNLVIKSIFFILYTKQDMFNASTTKGYNICKAMSFEP